MVHVKEESCIGCGKCIQDCPINKITLLDGKAKISGECILCGHCLAVCPTNSFSIDDYDMSEVTEYNRDSFHMDSDKFLNFIKFRRSVRNFKPMKVEENKIQKVLEAGRFTATGGNYQDVGYIVVQDNLEDIKELIWEGWKIYSEKLMQKNPETGQAFLQYYYKHKENSQNDRLFFNAPVLVVVTASNMTINGGLAAANVENMAVAEGLGVLYNGFVQYSIESNQEAKEWLGIDKEQIVTCMLFGYPDVLYYRTVPRKKTNIIWK